MNITRSFALPTFGLLVAASNLLSDSLEDLEWVNPKPQGHTLLGVAYGNGIYVAAGDGGTILTSSDHGATWTQRNTAVDADRQYESVRFLNGGFYAVGSQQFDGLISTSPDGITWNDQVLDSNGPIRGVAYGNNTYVTTGRTYTSSDGQTWMPGVNLSNYESDITFGNGLFVAVDRGIGFSSSIRTSPDGIDWTTVRNNDVLTSLLGVTFGDGRFVAVGYQQSLESTDAMEWFTHPQGFTFTPYDVTFRDGRFYATGQNVHSSSDGMTWTSEVSFQFDPVTFQPTTTNVGRAIAHSATSFVSVGTSGDVWNQVDGGDWTRQSEGFTADPLSDVTYGVVMVNDEPVGKYVATHSTLNAGSSGGLLVSDNGTDWNGMLRTGLDLRAVEIGNHRIAAVGKAQDSIIAPTRIYTSDDGLAFQEHTLPTNRVLLDVVFGNNTFVAVGETGLVFTSTYTDGSPGEWSEWTQQDPGVTFTLNSVAYGNGRFVAVGSPVPILESTDGAIWNSATGETTHNFLSVAYGNGIFVASGGFGPMTSPDGLEWMERTFPEGVVFAEIKFLNNRFVGLTTTDRIWVSANGLDWTEPTRFTVHELNGVTYDGEAYYLVGDDPFNPTTSTIIRSAVDSASFLRLEDFQRLANGDAQFNVFGEPGAQVQIRATSTFETWDVLDMITLETVPTLYTDTTAGAFTRRFFQASTGVPGF